MPRTSCVVRRLNASSRSSAKRLKNLRNADPETAEQIPEIARIIGLRNILAHAYTVVDDAVVWGAASQRVPELLLVVDQLLAH